MKDRNLSDTQEKRWIELARNNDLDAFNHLVLSYQDTAFSFASRMLNGDLFTEDVVQTAFLTAYRNIKYLRGNSFRAWLLKIIHNLCIDELRRGNRHPSMPLEPMNDEGQAVENADWLISPGLLPEELTIGHENWKEVERSIQQLPDHLREVLILIDIESLNYQDAAFVLNIPSGTIKSRLSRARLRIRAQLGEGFFGAVISDENMFEQTGVTKYVGDQVNIEQAAS